MKQVDDNGDGEISFDEFKEMMKKFSEWSIRLPLLTAKALLFNFYIQLK
jgi:hypothetical protein